MADGLSDLSDEQIRLGCRAWASRETWFPSLAELRTACVEYGPRRLPERRQQALPEPPAFCQGHRERMRGKLHRLKVAMQTDMFGQYDDETVRRFVYDGIAPEPEQLSEDAEA